MKKEQDNFITKAFSVTDDNFDKIALEIFKYQYEKNRVYNQYCKLINIDVEKINSLEKIPFLPIQFFKTHRIESNDIIEKLVFKSSGTTNDQRSQHFIKTEEIYQEVSKICFEEVYGPIYQYSILALLPNYIEQGNSSLVYMIDYFIKNTNHPSGFFLDNFNQLNDQLKTNKALGIPTILWGVTYALIDFALAYPQSIGDTIIIETGGTKGRRKEMTKTEIHDLLSKQFNCKKIGSEYGMTELLSQMYSECDGIFKTTKTAKILLREENDPFCIFKDVNKRGAINVVDLANLESCCFIATDDIGILLEHNKFRVEGRLDVSDTRGCSQMYS